MRWRLRSCGRAVCVQQYPERTAGDRPARQRDELRDDELDNGQQQGFLLEDQPAGPGSLVVALASPRLVWSVVSDSPSVAQFAALGTTAVIVVDDPRHLAVAREQVEREIAVVDKACSRFRDDSELTALNERNPRRVSPLLFEAITVALDAARATDGLVDPMLGSAMQTLGYDRNFASVPPDGPPLVFELPHHAPWEHVIMDRHNGTVTLPPNAQLDLGATAKAWCADRAAAAAALRPRGSAGRSRR